MTFNKEYLEIGAALSTQRLMAQANHLAGIALRDEISLGAHGWSTFRTLALLGQVAELREVLQQVGRDPILEEAVQARQELVALRDWGQQLTLALQNALPANHPVLENLKIPPALSREPLLRWSEPLLVLADTYEDELSRWGGGTLFLERGRELHRAVRKRGDSVRSNQLDVTAARLLELKAQLFIELERLVRCGRALWIDDEQAARDYHLGLLDPGRPIPAELLTAGLNPAAGFHHTHLFDPAPPGLDDIKEDFHVETLADAPVVPLGQEQVPLVPPGWYHEPDVSPEATIGAGSVMAEREQTASAEAGMAVGTEWNIQKAPDAKQPEARSRPDVPPGKGTPGTRPSESDQPGLEGRLRAPHR